MTLGKMSLSCVLAIMMMLLASSCMARTVMNQAKEYDDPQRPRNMPLHFCDPHCFNYYCNGRGNIDCLDNFNLCIEGCYYNDYHCLDWCAADCGC